MLNCFKGRQYSIRTSWGHGWAVQTSLMAGFDKIISFDMGGTSTDVAHYNGNTSGHLKIAGVRLRTPMMAIHTVAAGAVRFCNSMAHVIGWDQSQLGESGTSFVFWGGPGDSCNVMVSYSQFLSQGVWSNEICRWMPLWYTKSLPPGKGNGDNRTSEQVASGFLAIAVEKWRVLSKDIPSARLRCFGTFLCFLGEQKHACLIADALG